MADLDSTLRGTLVRTHDRIRVAMVAARYLPEMGGTEIHTHEVATRLNGLGVKVTVVTVSGSGAGEAGAVCPVPVVRVRAWAKRLDLFFAPGIAGALRRLRPEIVHVQGFHTLVAPMAMLASWRSSTPYVVTLHSGGHSSRLRTALRPLQARALKPLLNRAATLVAGSRFEAQQFARWLKLPLDRFTVLPSGVDLPLPADRDCTPSEREELVVSVGRLESYKGHQAIVRALPIVHRQRPNVRLRIAGRGRYEPKLLELISKLRIEEWVDIAPVPAGQRGEMARLLGRAAVVVSLSSYESQGIAMQEALALGRPLVVRDAAALAELGAHENVRLVSASADSAEIAEAILSMLCAPSVGPVVMPTWDECASAVLDIYDGVLALRR